MASKKLYDKKLFEFPVLWKGWEMDNKGWIAEKDGKKIVILTSHGTEYVAKERDLADRIKEYTSAIRETREAIRLLKDQEK